MGGYWWAEYSVRFVDGVPVGDRGRWGADDLVRVYCLLAFARLTGPCGEVRR